MKDYGKFDIKALQKAIKCSAIAIDNDESCSPRGGPFGAAIYKDGKLVCMKEVGKHLNKVIALDQNVDDYIFESLKHYDMGELKKRDE